MKFYDGDNNPISYNSSIMQVWDNKEQITSKLFQKKGTERDMIIKYLDVPIYMYNSSDGYRFFEALDKHSNMEIFGR